MTDCIGDGIVTIEALEVIADYSDCEDITYFVPKPIPGADTPCDYTCDMLEGLNETFYKQAVVEDNDNHKKYFERPKNSLHFHINVTNTDSWLKVLVQETNASNISISIHDINGNLIINKTGALTSGLNTNILDLSKLTTGVYLYMISTQGIVAKTGSFCNY